jgi:TIR domain
MEVFVGRTYPNGFSKSRLYEVYLSYRDFGCLPEEYGFDLEFTKLEEREGKENCRWSQDSDGRLIVAGLQLARNVRLEIMPNGFRELTNIVGYDAFIAHASEDKEMVAKPLAEQLKALGFWVWYDEFTLEIGDSLRQSIDRGLINSRFGIVILSPAFFAKQWPQYELNGLVARENEGTKVILPIWHQVEKQDVLRYSPPLADKLAVSTSKLSAEEVAKRLARVLAKGVRGA